MKAVMAIITGCLILNATLWAGELDKNCGCGLGSKVFKDKDSMMFQVLASLGNSVLFFNQAFGITFGTFGCEQPITMVQNERLDRFVTDNMDLLAREIAMGSGESLQTVAELLAVPHENEPRFFQALQSNFAAVFPSTSVTHNEVVQALERISRNI